MKLQPIVGTCSMAELTGVRGSLPTKSELFELIPQYRKETDKKPKAIICNINANTSWIGRVQLWWCTGFKRVFVYKGNSGRVETYMLNISKI